MILKIISIGIVATLTAITLRKINREAEIAVIMISSVIIVFLLYNDLASLINNVRTIALKSGVPDTYIKLVIKVIGIGYLCDFSSSVALDANETAIASKIEFAGKVSIITLSLPLYIDLIKMITDLLP